MDDHWPLTGVGSEGSLIGFGLLMVLVGVTIDIGVEFVKMMEVEVDGPICDLKWVFGLEAAGVGWAFSDSKSDSQS